MSHSRPKQSTGNYKSKRDRHEVKVPKGPRPPKNHGQGNSYIKPKYR